MERWTATVTRIVDTVSYNEILTAKADRLISR